MGSMIPYHQVLENEQDYAYSTVRFDHFEHIVMIKDWYCDNPECDCMSVGLYFLALHEDIKQTSELLYLMLDMNSWEIREQVIADKKNAGEMIAEFMDGMDELHLKDVFKEHYRVVKEYGKKHYRAEEETAFYQVPANSADDPLAFQYDGSRYLGAAI